MIERSVFFGACISLAAYILGIYVQRLKRLGFVNPILTAVVVVILFMLIFDIDYNDYLNSAQIMSFFITPATVCLAIPLYGCISTLKKNAAAIIAGIISGVLTSMLCVTAVAVIFSFNHEQYVSFLPKSVTTAIGLGIVESLGGIVPLSAMVIIITGIVGSIFCDGIFKIFKIRHPVSKGIAIGCSSHACGTARALQIGETEGAVSGLATVAAGIITVFSASFFANIL